MMEGLERFIVAAKAAAFVGGGTILKSSRPSSHDIGFELGNRRYLDSYLGGTDFLGQETVWQNRQAV